MKGLKSLLIASGVGIIGYALYRYYKKQIDFLKDYEYKVTGLRVVSLTSDNASFDVDTRITNISNVEAKVTEIYLDLYVNNALVGNINEVKDILVKANGFSDFSFRISFNPKIVLKNIINIVTLSVALKDVVVNLKGYIKVKSGIISTSIPFEYSTTLKEHLK
jgi:LEA14-like dessication related protein